MSNLVVDTLTNQDTQLCKAWVNFNGTSTVAIRGSYNVSSITDNGTGTYTANFTTAMPDVNYTTVIGTNAYRDRIGQTVSGTTTAMPQVVVYNSGDSATDTSDISLAVFR